MHRGKFLRLLSSITHLAVFAAELPQSKQLMHYIEFAPGSGQNLGRTFLAGFLGLSTRLSGSRKERLAFRNLGDSTQAATILTAFLGVGVIAENVSQP